MACTVASVFLMRCLLSLSSNSFAVLGAQTLDAEAKLPGDRDSKVDVGLCENMGRGVVRHELADELAPCDQRNKSERPYSFGFHRRFQRSVELSAVDIVDRDRLRVLAVSRPWRMSFDRPPICLRQAAPGDKFHDPGMIEHQDRRSLAA